MRRTPSPAFLVLSFLVLSLSFAAALPAFGQQITASPTSLKFANTYVGKTTTNQVITITNISTKPVTIESMAFDCPGGYGIASGVAPTQLSKTGTITHYSIFFQPSAAQAYNCNFVLTLQDNSVFDVPLTGTGLTSTAAASISPTSLTFANQRLGSTSAAQTVTISNTSTTSLNLNSITIEPPDFTTATIKLPYTIAAGKNLALPISYSPSHVTSETGAIDLVFDKIPDKGVTITGNGVAAAALSISTFATLPQATVSSVYQATLSTSSGVAPITWRLGAGAALPSGLTLSSKGVISGTLAASVKAGTYTFAIQARDSKSTLVSKTFTLGVYASLGDNCADISYNVPSTTTPIVALTDLGTGTYQGYEGGLYPNGSNVRPTTHDSDGVAFADAIQPLDASGNPDPNGKYVMLAIGESTAQQEFNSFIPIAKADPSKNPSLVIVNGAQGGATPNQLVSSSTYYWSTIYNNYLPQNNVTTDQVVAIWIEDTDAISSGSFPTDMTSMQAEYETLMQQFLTNFPNLKLVYFSSRVYAGYSNGVGNPDNPEPYAYEAGFAVKNAIADQLNGAANLNYNPALGPVVAPWMSWGPYYWSNGMLGRADGLVWDCEDFSPDGTHPSSTFGQLKVANALLNFLKTDDTTTPWYLAH